MRLLKLHMVATIVIIQNLNLTSDTVILITYHLIFLSLILKMTLRLPSLQMISRRPRLSEAVGRKEGSLGRFCAFY